MLRFLYSDISAINVKTTKATGSKCPICWKISEQACDKTLLMILKNLSKKFYVNLFTYKFYFYPLDRITKIYCYKSE